MGHFAGGLITPLQNFLEVGAGFGEEFMHRRLGNLQLRSNGLFGPALGKQQERLALTGR